LTWVAGYILGWSPIQVLTGLGVDAINDATNWARPPPSLRTSNFTNLNKTASTALEK